MYILIMFIFQRSKKYFEEIEIKYTDIKPNII